MTITTRSYSIIHVNQQAFIIQLLYARYYARCSCSKLGRVALYLQITNIIKCDECNVGVNKGT